MAIDLYIPSVIAEINRKANTQFNFIRKIGLPSVNSIVALIQNEYNQAYVLKLSNIKETIVFWNNKISVYEKLKNIRENKISLLVWDENTLKTKFMNIESIMTISYQHGVLSDSVGYVVEPYLENFITFEEACIELYKIYKTN